MIQYKVTQDQIRARTVPKTFSRGEEYYQSGFIINPVIRGDTIEAQCEAGSQSYPYQVSVTFDKNGIGHTLCTCEYDYGGDCKHIVALLLTYLNEPELFEELMPIEDILAERSKEELIALIKKMVKQHPDLQTFINRPTPGKNPTHLPVDTSVFRKDIKRAFTRFYHEEGASSIYKSLESTQETAREFVSFGDWKSASTIYRAMLEEFMSADTDIFMYDEEGDLVDIANECIAEIAECLEHLNNEVSERQEILNMLVDLYVWNDRLDYGDVGTDIPESLMLYARPDDLPAIRKKLIAAKNDSQALGYHWSVERYTQFLIEIDVIDNVDPEVILTRLRGEGMYFPLINKLIDMNRIDEAIAEIRQHTSLSHERMRVLPRLLEKGYGIEAVRLAEEVVERETYPFNTLDWILETLKKLDNKERYFHWQYYRMSKHPNMRYYDDLKDAAEVLGNWTDVQSELIRVLEKDQQYAVLTELYIRDENWDKAWDFLSKLQALEFNDYRWNIPSLEMQLAEKSRFANPEKSLSIYLKRIDKSIQVRNRDAYREAAHYLVVVRDLYNRLGEIEKWEDLVQKIKTEFKKLPALQDELRRAGL